MNPPPPPPPHQQQQQQQQQSNNFSSAPHSSVWSNGSQGQGHSKQPPSPMMGIPPPPPQTYSSGPSPLPLPPPGMSSHNGGGFQRHGSGMGRGGRGGRGNGKHQRMNPNRNNNQQRHQRGFYSCDDRPRDPRLGMHSASQGAVPQRVDPRMNKVDVSPVTFSIPNDKNSSSNFPLNKSRVRHKQHPSRQHNPNQHNPNPNPNPSHHGRDNRNSHSHYKMSGPPPPSMNINSSLSMSLPPPPPSLRYPPPPPRQHQPPPPRQQQPPLTPGPPHQTSSYSHSTPQHPHFIIAPPNHNVNPMHHTMPPGKPPPNNNHNINIPTNMIMNSAPPPPPSPSLKTYEIYQNSKTKSNPWTEHTAPSGVKYYYNSISKQSTYTKPPNFNFSTNSITNTNSITSTNSITNPTTTSPTQPTLPTSPALSKKTKAWSEYTDPKTNKKYYSDGTETTWSKPAEYSAPNLTLEPPAKKPKKQVISQTYNTKEEALAAFKGLLLQKDISPLAKYDQVHKVCQNDPRWNAPKTTGEKKQALAEYQTKRTNMEKDKQRKELQRGKAAFRKLLNELYTSEELPNNYKTVRNGLAKDDRFFAVENESTREDLFYEFLQECRKRQERLKRQKRTKAQESFTQTLNEMEGKNLLSYASTWKDLLKNNTIIDTPLETNLHMTESDRQLYFADYILDLQSKEDDKRRKIRDARRRAEKAQRDAYRTHLQGMATKGDIHIHSRWRQIQDSMNKTNTINPVRDQDADAPREIFEDFMEDLRELFRNAKQIFATAVNMNNIAFTNVSTYQQFCDLLITTSKEEYKTDIHRLIQREPVSGCLLFYHDMVHKYDKTKDTNSLRQSHTAGILNTTFRKKLAEESEDEGMIIEDGEIGEEQVIVEEEVAAEEEKVVELN